MRHDLKYQIKWRNAWRNMRIERIKKPKVTYDQDFLRKSARDFSNRCKWNDYECGRKAVKFLSNILKDNFEVLEIGSGPGTLTLPLSKKVKKITCVEASKINSEFLKKNASEKEVKNIELINDYWGKVEIRNKFDLVVCAHFLWMVEYLEKHLERMEHFSKRYCAIIQPCDRDEVVRKAFEEICKEEYTGQFEPDADYFVYVILREWGRLLDVQHFEYFFELGLREGVRYVAGFLGKFIEVDEEVVSKIKEFLASEVGETWKVRNKSIVIWWDVKK